MTKQRGSANGDHPEREQGDERKRRLSDPHIVFERLADIASDFDQVRDMAIDLDQIRQEQRALLDKLRDLLKQATEQLNVLNGKVYAAEQRFERLRQVDSRVEQVLTQAEKTLQEWQAAEGTRAQQWREQTDAAVKEQLRALSRRAESSEALSRSASESVEQALGRVGTMDRTFRTQLTDLQQAMAAERAARQHAVDEMAEEIAPLREAVSRIGRRTRQGTMIAVAAVLLVLVGGVSFAILLGTGILTLVNR